MEHIFLGGRQTVGFGDRWAAGFPLDIQDPKNRIPTSPCGESLAPVQSSGAEVGCGSPKLGKPETGGVFLPAWVAGISAGLTAAQLAVWGGLPLPPRGVLSSLVGVGTGLAVWAKLR